jgi:phage terminase large subunit
MLRPGRACSREPANAGYRLQHGAAPPNVPELVRELTETTCTFVGGKLQLEAKDQVKARLGSSPDLAEALATTFALDELPKGMTPARGVGHPVHDFEPYAEREAR